MKNLLLITALLSLNAYATKPTPPPAADQEQQQAQSQQQSALAKAIQAQHATTGNQSMGDQISNLQFRYDAASASAAAIDLAYCSDGNSAQGLKGGFGVGQVNFVCESIMGINVALSRASAEILQAKECHDSKNEETKKLAQEHLDRAHTAFEDVADIQELVNDYIQDRSKTAKWGAWTRDLSLPLVILGVLIAL